MQVSTHETMYSDKKNSTPSSGWLLFWRAAFFLILAVGFWVYVRRGLAGYEAAPIPKADALEYFWIAKCHFEGQSPAENPFLDRWPGLPLVVAMFWHLTGVTSAVQYLIGAVSMVLAVMMAGIIAWKREGPILALTSMALLLFLPTCLENANHGLTDSFFAMLAVQFLAVGYLLPQKPLLYAIPAAITAALLVLSREGGHFFVPYALALFMIFYYKRRQFSLRLAAVLGLCALTALGAFWAQMNYIHKYNLIPMGLRYGIAGFYYEFLQNRVVFYDDHRVYALMSYWDWLNLHPVGDWPGIFLHSFSNLLKIFDSTLFPGASILVAAGIIRAAIGKWTLEALYCLPLIFIYIPYYYLSIETRYLTHFCCIGLPMAISGIVLIANSLSPKSKILSRKRLAAILPPAFCLIALGSAYFIKEPPNVKVLRNLRFPDQKELQTCICSLLMKGRFDEAADSIKAGLSRNPELATFHLANGYVSYIHNHRIEAFENIERSISLNPYQTEAYYVAFHLSWREGQLEKATGYLERSLKYRPEFPITRQLLRDIYQSTGRVDSLKILERKGPFNYYLQHPKLRIDGQKNFLYWCVLLQLYTPAKGFRISPLE
ncbi:MAG TPA: hypothetical protein VM123_02875 [archaeon]|nr:hypothetical protein [archaeon]